MVECRMFEIDVTKVGGGGKETRYTPITDTREHLRNQYPFSWCRTPEVCVLARVNPGWGWGWGWLGKCWGAGVAAWTRSCTGGLRRPLGARRDLRLPWRRKGREMPVQTAAAGAERGNQGGAWNSCKLRQLLPPSSHPGCRLPFQVAHKHLLSQKPRLKNRQPINYLIFLFFSWPVLPVVVGFVCGVKITENKVGNYQGRGRGALWMNVRPGGRGGVQSRTVSCVIFLREQMTATSIYLGDV